jgi:hypothetical protein
MTPAERQQKRRARLAAERPKRDIRVDKLSRLFVEVERLRAELGMHDPRDVEMSRLQAENTRLQADVARLQAGAAEKTPGDDEEHRAVVKRLQRRIAQLEAERRVPFADAAILQAERRAKSLFKSIKPTAGGKAEMIRAKTLMDGINVAIHNELERRRKVLGRIEKSLAELTAIAPDKARDLRRKLEAMATDPGASEGERANARAAIARMK